MKTAKCRFCNENLTNIFVDLGMSPLSNSFIDEKELDSPEIFYPLKAFVCDSCLLVQLQEFESPEKIFKDYAYFSSFSDSWLDHAREYCEMAIDRFGLSKKSLVVELASNDGYLLKNFVANEIPVVGIEPAKNVADKAVQNGVPTVSEFFGMELSRSFRDNGKHADLIIGNNVLAHVPDINDFVSGIRGLLKPDGIATLEFPHLLQLILQNQFDTIYHEHFSYLSFISVKSIFEYHGLTIFDVDELPTHGGSLRIYATPDTSGQFTISGRVEALMEKEKKAGLNNLKTYLDFSERVKKVKFELLQKLLELKQNNSRIVAYGAAAKGNTLLNYCGIRTDFIDYVVDRNPHKIGNYLPGTHIPVKHVDTIEKDKPDYVLILPWNLQEEIISQNRHIKHWGGKFIIPVPKVQITE